MQGYNWFLIVVTVVLAALAVLTALYLVIHYQHPEDRNQVSSCKNFAAISAADAVIIWLVECK